MIRYAIDDRTGKIDPAEIDRVARALTWSSEMFAAPPPFGWGIPFEVRAASAGAPVMAVEWPVLLLEAPSGSANLGEHSVDELGRPVLRVYPFLDPTAAWSAIADHEIKEAGPDAMCGGIEVTFNGKLAAREIADPVECDTYTVPIDGVPVVLSNWVTPAWFAGRRGSEPIDYLGRLSAPLTRTPGGYFQILDPRRGWQENFGDQKSAYRRALHERGLGRGAQRRRRWKG